MHTVQFHWKGYPIFSFESESFMCMEYGSWNVKLGKVCSKKMRRTHKMRRFYTTKGNNSTSQCNKVYSLWINCVTSRIPDKDIAIYLSPITII